jgi:hypothetical protein
VCVVGQVQRPWCAAFRGQQTAGETSSRFIAGSVGSVRQRMQDKEGQRNVGSPKCCTAAVQLQLYSTGHAALFWTRLCWVLHTIHCQ